MENNCVWARLISFNFLPYKRTTHTPTIQYHETAQLTDEFAQPIPTRAPNDSLRKVIGSKTHNKPERASRREKKCAKKNARPDEPQWFEMFSTLTTLSYRCVTKKNLPKFVPESQKLSCARFRLFAFALCSPNRIFDTQFIDSLILSGRRLFVVYHISSGCVGHW